MIGEITERMLHYLVAVQCLVGTHAVDTRVFFKQPVAQLALCLQLPHLGLQVGWVGAKVFQGNNRY